MGWGFQDTEKHFVGIIYTLFVLLSYMKTL